MKFLGRLRGLGNASEVPSEKYSREAFEQISPEARTAALRLAHHQFDGDTSADPQQLWDADTILNESLLEAKEMRLTSEEFLALDEKQRATASTWIEYAYRPEIMMLFAYDRPINTESPRVTRRAVLGGVLAVAGSALIYEKAPFISIAMQDFLQSSHFETERSRLRSRLQQRYGVSVTTAISPTEVRELDRRKTKGAEISSRFIEIRALAVLERAFSQYPPPMIAGAIKQVTIVTDLVSHEAKANGMYVPRGWILINSHLSGNVSGNGFRGINESTVHHELGHALTLHDPAFVARWRSIPGQNAYRHDDWKRPLDRRGFVSRYATKNMAEDMAEVMRLIMMNPGAAKKMAGADRVIREKIRLLTEALAAGPASKSGKKMDQSYWTAHEAGTIDESYWD